MALIIPKNIFLKDWYLLAAILIVYSKKHVNPLKTGIQYNLCTTEQIRFEAMKCNMHRTPDTICPYFITIGSCLQEKSRQFGINTTACS